jgi:hypothetical protein
MHEENNEVCDNHKVLLRVELTCNSVHYIILLFCGQYLGTEAFKKFL